MSDSNANLAGWLRLEISADSMQAFLSVVPPTDAEGEWPTVAAAKDLLRQEGVNYGVLEEVLSSVVEKRVLAPTLIAQGDPMTPGNDAELEFLFPTEKIRIAFKELEDGRVDYRDISTIVNVKKDDVLVKKTPLTPGESGKDIRSREIAAKPGRDKTLLTGKNVAWTSDGLTVIALDDGEPTLVGNRLSVNRVHEVTGGVNFRSGNIDFLGNVIIRGTIESGFTVRADGDITVYGNVEAGMVTCGGNLTVYGGIIGQDKSEIQCEGDFSVFYIERATVDIGGNLTIRDAAMHSRISAGGSVLMQGRKGLLVGGICRAGELVDTKVIGSRLGTATEIEVGVNPRIRQELIKTEESLKEHYDNLDKTSKILRLLDKDPTSQRSEMRDKLGKTAAMLTLNISQLEKHRDELAEEVQNRYLDRGRVKVYENIFPGVRVTIGKATKLIRDEIRHATLVYEAGEVMVQAYR